MYNWGIIHSSIVVLNLEMTRNRNSAPDALFSDLVRSHADSNSAIERNVVLAWICLQAHVTVLEILRDLGVGFHLQRAEKWGLSSCEDMSLIPWKIRSLQGSGVVYPTHKLYGCIN